MGDIGTTVLRVAGCADAHDVLKEIHRAAAGAGARLTSEQPLARDDLVADEWVFDRIAPEDLRRAVRPVLLEAEIDFCFCAPREPGARMLVLFDVDSTLIHQEVIELIADRAGSRDEVAAVTAAAMRGELDFAESLHQRVATLRGVDVAALTDVFRQVTLTAGARTTVDVLRSRGHRVGVVSGGFIEVVAPLARALGVDHARANALEVADGRLTGRVKGAVVDRAAKAAALREWSAREQVEPSCTVAVGDGANDLDMVATAGVGVAFCAKPALRAVADATISVPRLDMLLPFLGFSEEDVSASLFGRDPLPGL
ncbi:phosphoserine phosphatase SerB [Austwickia chelonae]|uniref:phosphoserine phosphatase n=1 Tax=Austwickia chelonae NBRC 105200 TaxID=1184607 RepID=K6VL07_9MICO|nr:phosphoserine phosphatase SerB [Austwickia chelonae]GAB77424.1 phosphoserine phosphatase [Austwickia chelonae NBRC 105200]SEW10157.1 phosphoserine phosphatase SerB [Austwickia chelonae]